MKKNVAVLKLNKETIRNLTSNDLRRVRGGGGGDVTTPGDMANDCPGGNGGVHIVKGQR